MKHRHTFIVRHSSVAHLEHILKAEIKTNVAYVRHVNVYHALQDSWKKEKKNWCDFEKDKLRTKSFHPPLTAFCPSPAAFSRMFITMYVSTGWDWWDRERIRWVCDTSRWKSRWWKDITYLSNGIQPEDNKMPSPYKGIDRQVDQSYHRYHHSFSTSFWRKKNRKNP